MSPHVAKYIIIQRDGREYPVLFPCAIPHNEMVSTFAGTPVSAGFYMIVNDQAPITDGLSETLNLKSRPDIDSTLIHQLLTSN